MWWWWLLLMNLLVWLQMIESLKHSMHKLTLCGYELLQLRVVVGSVGLVIAGLAIAMIVSRVHHLRDFLRREV
jgi:hypothetical protein